MKYFGELTLEELWVRTLRELDIEYDHYLVSSKKKTFSDIKQYLYVKLFIVRKGIALYQSHSLKQK